MSSTRPIALVKNLFAVFALGILFWLVDVREVIHTFSQLTWQSVVALGVVSVFLVYVSAVKWGIFLARSGSPVSTLRLFNLYLVGYFINLIVPSYVGGDAVRSWYVGAKVGQHHALASTILERYTGVLAMMILALLSLLVVRGLPISIVLAVVGFSLALVGVTIIALSPKLLTRVEVTSSALLGKRSRVIGKSFSHLHKIQAVLRQARSEPKLVTRALLLSFVYHTFTVVNTLAAAYALGWTSAPIADLFAVLPLILIIGALPISPSGLGIQEGAFFYFLTRLGASPAQALGVGLVLRAKSYVLAFVGGVIWLRLKASAKQLGSSSPAPSPVPAVTPHLAVARAEGDQE